MDLQSLNTNQRKAVELTDGPIMILAGAGSGKTRTLVQKIKYLLTHKRISTHQILAVTFSNKAAREMRERITQQLDQDVGGLQITTFHSFCASVLRKEFNYLGLSRNFTIYDDSESKAVVKNILARRGISTKEISPFEVLQYFSELKNLGYYPGRDREEDRQIDQQDLYYAFYLEYEEELRRSNAVDFGGLIVGTIQLLEKYPDVCERYQRRYRYILVDEYQDTNRAQFDLISLLADRQKNLCVVGDEDQSIYSWRGADIRNILDFEARFPDVQMIKLEQNYRSSKTIIEAATHLIARNQMRKGKNMWTDNQHGDSVTIMECPNDKGEAHFVATEIKQLMNQGITLDDVSIFYRNNSQSRLIEDALRQHNIAYRVVGGIKFYERKEIKDVLAYMRLVVNIKDSLALSRIINVPARGIGATSLRKIESEATQQNCSLWEILVELLDRPEDFAHLRLSRKVKSGLLQLECLVSEIRALDQNGEKPSVCVEKIIHESGYFDYLRSQKDYESQARLENLEEFLNALKQYEETNKQANFVGFLENITLDSGQKEDSSLGEVSLMTVHGSKGLEFPYVFIVGAEENLFPSYKSLEMGETALEEERRLFYVAMTRAMKKLYIVFANGRMLFGSLKFNGPSRFLYEIPEEYLNWERVEINEAIASRKSNDDFDYSDEYSQDINYDASPVFIKGQTRNDCKFAPDDLVLHSLYGEGRVLESTGQGNDEKVVVLFGDGSKKRFMVKFAPLTPLQHKS